MEIKLELFVRKVRYQLRMKANLDEWTEPEILTQEVLDMILDEENQIIEEVLFVPLEGRTYFTLLGVGNISKFNLNYKPT